MSASDIAAEVKSGRRRFSALDAEIVTAVRAYAAEGWTTATVGGTFGVTKGAIIGFSHRAVPPVEWKHSPFAKADAETKRRWAQMGGRAHGNPKVRERKRLREEARARVAQERVERLKKERERKQQQKARREEREQQRQSGPRPRLMLPSLQESLMRPPTIIPRALAICCWNGCEERVTERGKPFCAPHARQYRERAL